jgi:ferredoxin-NADP reductase
VTDAADTIEVVVSAKRMVADDVALFALAPKAGRLPPVEPGAHVRVVLPGRDRSYSIVDAGAEGERYDLAVLRDPNSRGGSIHMHDRIVVGDVLRIGRPVNNFRLIDDAGTAVLIAGGIGVTPLLAMARARAAAGRPWTLVYAARRRSAAAFVAEIERLAREGGGTVRFHFDDENDGRPLDLRAVLEAAPADAHLYCCGPAGMLTAFEAMTALRPRDHVHVERFTAAEEADSSGGFEIVLARSGKTLRVEPGKSILDTILEQGIFAKYSCTEGVCGECETAVIEGTPVHRDSYLLDEEKAANDRMMICCSGCAGARLVLDI